MGEMEKGEKSRPRNMRKGEPISRNLTCTSISLPIDSSNPLRQGGIISFEHFIIDYTLRQSSNHPYSVLVLIGEKPNVSFLTFPSQLPDSKYLAFMVCLPLGYTGVRNKLDSAVDGRIPEPAPSTTRVYR